VKVGDLVRYRNYPTTTIGVIIDAARTGSYIGVVWSVHPTSVDKGVTYHHRFDLELLETDKKCPGEKYSIEYITNTTTEE